MFSSRCCADRGILPIMTNDTSLLIPGNDVVHRLVHTALAAELTGEASLLIIDAGTGPEMKEYVSKHPGWTARFHVGAIEEAPEEQQDAAVLLFMLHHIPDEEKAAMLCGIADRLKPGAPFLMATLFGDPETTRFKRMNDLRKAWAIEQGIEPAMAEQFCDPRRDDMHIVSEERLKGLFREGGFIDAQRIYQALTVGLWLARAPR